MMEWRRGEEYIEEDTLGRAGRKRAGMRTGGSEDCQLGSRLKAGGRGMKGSAHREVQPEGRKGRVDSDVVNEKQIKSCLCRLIVQRLRCNRPNCCLCFVRACDHALKVLDGVSSTVEWCTPIRSLEALAS
ncbi:hypothetical protein E2C01_035166 [Portunus trituberculatus]|uniref:Uncharacterized protein n=1 Tax=Portunus trituberculatus TaxID=210409 RepID=A0A5B7F7Q6_PORTR|nr:hypothetical protein [Portunus trituberculatus]